MRSAWDPKKNTNAHFVAFDRNPNPALITLTLMVVFLLKHYVRAFTSGNFILFYFTTSKSYFINYTIQVYNISSILTFIFPFYIKIIFLHNKIIYSTITSFTIQNHHHHKPTTALHTPDTTITTSNP